MSRFLDITGQRFGKLQVLEFSHIDKRNAMWRCRCDCGTLTIARGTSLRYGTTKSCGCGSKEMLEMRTTHGMSGTKEYWQHYNRVRRERKAKLDFQWLIEMQLALQDLQKECVLCGSKELLHIDHVQPLSKGYSLSPGNAVMLCRSCNLIKGSKMLHELLIENQSKLVRAAEEFRLFWQKNKSSYTLSPF